MTPHRLRAPRADGALLEEPPLTEADDRLARNAASLADWEYDFQGRNARRVRSMARLQVVEQSRAYLTRHGLEAPKVAADASPFVVTGHQPELYHPGVWVKNFATDALAKRNRGIGLNLIVDNDTPKSTSIRVPHLHDVPFQVRRIDFDDWAGEVPFEDLPVRDEVQFESFGARVKDALAGAVVDPLIDDFWPRVLRQRDRTRRLGIRFAAARRELEASWGVNNFDVPLGAVCETEGFLWFASHLLAQLPKFQQIHNQALARYRTTYGIRSKHHPVPALVRQDDWLEAPFWIWRADSPRRRPLLVRQLARTMLLRIAGDDEPFLELPLAPDREACCAVEQLRQLPAQRIRLRTRALTTTMFARLLLGDLFIHGIGGAKYDELGDEISRRFFGFEPPEYLTLSLTVWLGLPTAAGEMTDLRVIERRLRDLTYNPDRYIDPGTDGKAWDWVEAKRAAVAASDAVDNHSLERFRQIRRCNEALAPFVEEQRGRLLVERARLLNDIRQNVLARSREYSFTLHSAARLREVMSRVVRQILPN